VSPSVWILRTYDAAGRAVAQGSAVVVARDRLVTNCNVLANARYARVRRKNVEFDATLEYADVRRDLCLLHVDNFGAPAAVIRLKNDLKVGERVFAIGNPVGFEVTLSDGLISGIRTMRGRLAAQGVDELIQTTAPISAGSAGGGLFDAEGRLVGITTLGSVFRLQNINFALPADWIADIPARARAALAERATKSRVSVGAPGLPAAGTSWKYSVLERIYSSAPLEVTVRVLRVDGATVEERLTSSAGGRDAERAVDARASRFFEFRLDSDNDLVELSPYLLAVSGARAPADSPEPVGYPLGGGSLPGWAITLSDRGWEQVTVPAGTYRALRFDLAGHRTGRAGTRGGGTEGRFEMSVWYAPEVKRFVKLVRKVWSADAFSPSQTGEYVVELLAYRPPS
ncbi:MAG: serine protease, partial [Burkholderiales bacterium]